MDIDTTPPSSHHDGRPPMQLDLPPADDVMMELDPDLSATSTPTPSPIPFQSSTSSMSPLAHNSPRVSSDPASSKPLPIPPVVLISSSDSPAWPKFKLDQLFVEWLARPESIKWLDALLEDARAGKPPEHLIAEHATRLSRFDRVLSSTPARTSTTPPQTTPTVSPQQAPGSPVSRLFSNHIPFAYADTSPRSPPSGPSAIAALRSVLTSPNAAADLDLGRSGSASPISKPSPEFGIVSAEKLDKTHDSASRDKSSLQATADKDNRLARAEDISAQAKDQASHLPDSKILDTVADGIAGMSAAVDAKPRDTESQKQSAAESKAKQEAVEGRQQEHLASSHESMTREKGVRVIRIQRGQKSQQSQLPSEIVHHSTDVSTNLGKDTVSDISISASDKQAAAVTSESAPVSETSKAAAPSAQEPAVKDVDMTAEQEAAGARVDGVVTVSTGQRRLEKSVRQASSAIPPSGAKSAKVVDTVMTEVSVPKKRKTLPKFYFPCGRDAESRERKEKEVIKEFFRAQRSQKNLEGVNRTDIAELVVEVIGLPSYFAGIVFNLIQELFPSTNETGLAANRPSDNVRAGSSNAREESSMKDVGQPDEDMRGKRRGQEPSNTRDDSGATNSDTTMGDVNDAISEDGRANGFAQEGAGANGSNAGQQNTGPNGDSTAVQATSRPDMVTEPQFLAYYTSFCEASAKEARLFSALKDPKAKRDYLIPSDFKPLLRALLVCHQGLAFLHATPEFQQRYSETVIERIYFGCTRQHNGRLTLNDIKRSKLLDTLMVVDEEEDINRERKYFSYEHFYVLYCRFWELDANHDLQIDREDLMRYGSHSLTYRIVDRIFGGYARPLDCPENPGYMSYTDFIWFCLSEEDKTSDTAIDYWFRCVDMDGDGLITMYDMEFFYKEQLHRMECFGHEPVQIRDILCQLLDMINPNVRPPVIRRRDLRRCRLASNFFNVLFNLNKFFAIEARDPLQIRQEHATPELTDWDRFAALEYLRLSAEEEGEEDESWEDVGDATNPLMAGEAPF